MQDTRASCRFDEFQGDQFCNGSFLSTVRKTKCCYLSHANVASSFNDPKRGSIIALELFF